MGVFKLRGRKAYRTRHGDVIYLDDPPSSETVRQRLARWSRPKWIRGRVRAQGVDIDPWMISLVLQTSKGIL